MACRHLCAVCCLVSTVMFVYLLSLFSALREQAVWGLLSQHMAHLQLPSLTQTVSGNVHTHTQYTRCFLVLPFPGTFKSVCCFLTKEQNLCSSEKFSLNSLLNFLTQLIRHVKMNRSILDGFCIWDGVI